MKLTTIMIGLGLYLGACADEPAPEPECESATQYNGAAVACRDGAGICIARGAEAECMPLCDASGPVCTEGEQWASIVVRGSAPVCYCEPLPTAHVWTPIVRDHR